MHEDAIYTGKNFCVWIPREPHQSRIDGGHLVISSTGKYYDSRLDFTPEEAKEAMFISMLTAEAMIKGMKKTGINIGRINYQENGNWAFIRNEKPFFHIHIYGRTENSVDQKWGEALYFPDPSTGYYKGIQGLTEEDAQAIKEEIEALLKTEKYDYSKW